MAGMKDLMMDVLEALEKTNFDYEYVAEKFGMNPKEVYAIAKNFGDVE